MSNKCQYNLWRYLVQIVKVGCEIGDEPMEANYVWKTPYLNVMHILYFTRGIIVPCVCVCVCVCVSSARYFTLFHVVSAVVDRVSCTNEQ